MMEIAATAVLIVAMLGSAAAGLAVRRRIHERHLSAGAVDSVRLLMGMLLTFAALVLGLLTSNAKQRFDGLSDNLSTYAAELIELNQNLDVFGPAAADARRGLRQYTAAAIASTWTGEAAPAGDYPRLPMSATQNGIEGIPLGRILNELNVAIAALPAPDEFHQRIAATLHQQIGALIGARWQLIFASQSTVAWPFLLILMTWLCIIFAIFGMTSPPSRVVSIVVVLSALSIASPLYLIIDYSDALSGSIVLSSSPMRVALAHMDAPSP